MSSSACGNCNIEIALDLLVGKWKPVILYHIIKHEILSFSELQRLIPEITRKMLTSQLRDLEYQGVVHRKDYSQMPLKVEYSITEYGKSVIPMIKSMHHWGTEHLKRTLKEPC